MQALSSTANAVTRYFATQPIPSRVSDFQVALFDNQQSLYSDFEIVRQNYTRTITEKGYRIIPASNNPIIQSFEKHYVVIDKNISYAQDDQVYIDSRDLNKEITICGFYFDDRLAIVNVYVNCKAYLPNEHSDQVFRFSRV